MPLLLGRTSGGIINVIAAGPGFRVEVSAADSMDTSSVPAPSWVVGWVLVADETVAGGARIDPVFLAAGQTWTPDQYRATYGERLAIRVERGQ